MKKRYTKRQMENWKRYERVRAGGMFNMFDPAARIMTGLSATDYAFCMDQYEGLASQAEEVKAK